MFHKSRMYNEMAYREPIKSTAETYIREFAYVLLNIPQEKNA
jgi:hypothetical protein